MSKHFLFSVALVALMISGCNNSTQTSSSPSFNDVLASRRSIRSYDSTKTISEAEVRELLTAVQEAPSWAANEILRGYEQRESRSRAEPCGTQ